MSSPPPAAFSETPVRFILRNGATSEKHLIETMAGGVAVLDFNGDGRPDLFFTNGTPQPALIKSGPDYYNRLLQNRGNGTFEDVTDRAGLRGEGYSMGAAVADYDNDGQPDLFVAGVNRNSLYHNRGDGTFEDVTERSGIAGRGQPWSVAGAWLDYDRDGRLDLFVVQYVKWDPVREPFCGDDGRTFRTYCHPKFYEGLPNRLYHNEGDGRFREVSAEAGISGHIGKGMGVAVADYDQDGYPDLFVANDTVPNFLFHNERNGRFKETGVAAGIAYNDDGRALSSMGADFRDYDGDGKPDLFLTALLNETFPLFRNLGRGVFADETYRSGVGRSTLPLSGWGAGIYDFDNDGRKDLFAANGDVQDNTELFSSRASRQGCLILRQTRPGAFEPYRFDTAALHRGAAFADFDGDGLVDAVVTRLNAQAVLLRNGMRDANRYWLRVRLEGTRSNRDGLGAVVHLVTKSGQEHWNHATTSVGYASSSEAIVHFGLGPESVVDRVEIQWPSGVMQTVKSPGVNRLLSVREPSATDGPLPRSPEPAAPPQTKQ